MPSLRPRPADLPIGACLLAAAIAAVAGALGAWQVFAAASALTLGALALLLERTRRSVAAETAQILRRQGRVITAIDKRTGTIERQLGRLRRAGDRQTNRFDQLDNGLDVVRTTVIRRADRTDARIAGISVTPRDDRGERERSAADRP